MNKAGRSLRLPSRPWWAGCFTALAASLVLFMVLSAQCSNWKWDYRHAADEALHGLRRGDGKRLVEEGKLTPHGLELYEKYEREYGPIEQHKVHSAGGYIFWSPSLANAISVRRGKLYEETVYFLDGPSGAASYMGCSRVE